MKVHGADHPNVAMSLNNLAAVYVATKNYATAEPLYKRSLTIMTKALGPNHPALVTNLENLAALYRATNRDEEAGQIENQAARILALQQR